MSIILTGNAGQGDPFLGIKKGIKAILEGANSVPIVFTSPFLNDNYLVIVTLENTGDTPPVSIYSYTVIDKTADGFTVSFSGDMDSENYKLNWIAQKY